SAPFKRRSPHGGALHHRSRRGAQRGARPPFVRRPISRPRRSRELREGGPFPVSSALLAARRRHPSVAVCIHVEGGARAMERSSVMAPFAATPAERPTRAAANSSA